MAKHSSERTTAIEAAFAAILALGLYLPFLAIQYDVNGIAEAAALEARQLVNKNHMLYRPIGLLLYHAVQRIGYTGNSLLVLQTMNAICGAAGVGLAYAVFKSATRDKAAAAMGSFLLGTSFVYWLFSTDAAYIPLAAAFALAAMASLAYTQSWVSVVAAGVWTSLSILTWQADIFLVPTLLSLLIARGRRPLFRHAAIFAMTLGLTAGASYMLAAVASHGWLGLRGFWTWFSSYSEGGTPLPQWGVWGPERIENASVSALRSIVPVLLAEPPSEITRSVQLGRVAVDVSLIALALLVVLASIKTRLNSLRFLLGY